MDESTKKALEGIQKASKLTESLKMNSATQKLMDEMKNMVPKIQDFGLTGIERTGFTMPEIPRMPTHEELNEYQSASVFM
jgi:hypothetical protein